MEEASGISPRLGIHGTNGFSRANATGANISRLRAPFQNHLLLLEVGTENALGSAMRMTVRAARDWTL